MHFWGFGVSGLCRGTGRLQGKISRQPPMSHPKAPLRSKNATALKSVAFSFRHRFLLSIGICCRVSLWNSDYEAFAVAFYCQHSEYHPHQKNYRTELLFWGMIWNHVVHCMTNKLILWFLYFMSFHGARISPVKGNYMTWKMIWEIYFLSWNGLHDRTNCFGYLAKVSARMVRSQ